MEASELIEGFRKQLDAVDAQGSKYLSTDSLRQYLDTLEKDASASQKDRDRQHAGMLAYSAAKNTLNIEVMKSVLEAGKSALHALLIINGGAVVALLGVFSNILGKKDSELLAQSLALPLLFFGAGVLSGALGFAFRYFSQNAYAKSFQTSSRSERGGDFFRFLAVFSALGGYLAFGYALFSSYKAVLHSFS